MVSSANSSDNEQRNDNKKISKKKYKRHRSSSSSSSSSSSESSSASESRKHKSKSKKHSKRSKKKPKKLTFGFLKPQEEWNKKSEKSNKSTPLPVKEEAPSSKLTLKIRGLSPRTSEASDSEVDLIQEFEKDTKLNVLPTTSNVNQQLVSEQTSLLETTSINRRSSNDTLKNLRLKATRLHNQMIPLCKVLMICQNKGCQFGVLHECRRLFSDIVSDAHKIESQSGTLTDTLEVGKLKECQYCPFKVIHKLCQKKPDDKKFGMYTSVTSRTRVCTNCNWQMTYTFNGDQIITWPCHWTSDSDNQCGCGCIEIQHSCTLQLK